MTKSSERPDKERIIAVLRREPVDRVPIHENVINGRFIKHLLGADFETSLDMDPRLHIEMAGMLGMDLVTLGEFWRVPIPSRETLVKLEPPDISVFLGRVDEYLELLKGGPAGLNVYVHGPFDQTYLSIGYERFFMALYDDLPFVEAVMELYTERSLALIRGLRQRDVSTIEIVDDIAYGKGLMVNPDILEALWLPRMRRLLEPVLDADVPRFFHSDGDVSQFIEYVIGLGFQGMNPIEPLCNDIVEIRKAYGDRLVLMGNLDVGGVLATGSEEEVRLETAKMLSEFMPGGGYVAMSGSRISDAVRPENYIAMTKTVKSLGRY